jgi:hypothetical protein
MFATNSLTVKKNSKKHRGHKIMTRFSGNVLDFLLNFKVRVVKLFVNLFLYEMTKIKKR